MTILFMLLLGSHTTH